MTLKIIKICKGWGKVFEGNPGNFLFRGLRQRLRLILGHGSDNTVALEHYYENNLEEYIGCCFHY